MKIGWKCWLKKSCHCEERHGQKHLGRRGNPVAIQGGHALATRLPRYARNDIFFIFALVGVVTNNSFNPQCIYSAGNLTSKAACKAVGDNINSGARESHPV
ncbi:hypothetical protein MTO98_29105 [Mucilaginibacter sp. SMC90]|uniref:hypothetical protein n=1 Tax=Mucilaginibacter sp. SMC90 TaxID=2929803 RepID=UPI001FB414C9|nr:hypothetical protein [Mucilaginibacter sp. SMC90]UOE48470.1 hypothetical protein MTO98_29105 [Mucilaginibacter sp. SMC90]